MEPAGHGCAANGTGFHAYRRPWSAVARVRVRGQAGCRRPGYRLGDPRCWTRSIACPPRLTHRMVSTSRAGMQTGFQVIPAVVADLRDMHEALHRGPCGDRHPLGLPQLCRAAGRLRLLGAAVRGSRCAQGECPARPLRAPAWHGHRLHERRRQPASPVGVRRLGDHRGRRLEMLANAWRFGFVLRAIQGQASADCYAYEPWHYRYVGRDLARQIHESGETPREYLWERANPGGVSRGAPQARFQPPLRRLKQPSRKTISSVHPLPSEAPLEIPCGSRATGRAPPR